MSDDDQTDADALTSEEQRWWARFQRCIREMPQGLTIQVTVTGAVTVHRRVDGSNDNVRESLGHMRGEHRIYPSGSGSAVWS